MIIFIHSSKTMRPAVDSAGGLRRPELVAEAGILAAYLRSLSRPQLVRVMGVSDKLAASTQQLLAAWTDDPAWQRAAIDSFLGDIYSGLQVSDWSAADREYADSTLRILSGLYGILRPLDGMYPYRLEMGYRLPAKKFANLYAFWGDSIARTLPANELIINLAAVEYSRVITPFVSADRIVTPKFLTYSAKTKEPVFVTVHAKIARGTFASWIIRNRISERDQLKDFDELGYEYDAQLSGDAVLVFVCKEFGGLGLSIRLK